MPALIVIATILVGFNLGPGWLEFEYSRPGFPKSERFNDKDRLYYAVESDQYEIGNRTFEQFKALGVYNEREIRHMVDVRVLLERVTVFEALGGLFCVIALVVLARSRVTRPLAARALLAGGLLTILLFGAVSLLAATSFDTSFVEFHYLFFEGDSGFFLFSDSLIQFYPEVFWFDSALALSGLTVFESAIIALIGWVWGQRSHGSHQAALAQA
jgi:integral membrane protein (TIGR01906 family)